jgi:plasmid maintenance system antidote protein VapI
MTQPNADRDRETCVQAVIEELIAKARTGDASVADQLQRVLDLHPEIWQQFGDLAGHAERAWLDLYAGKDLAIKASAARKLAAMRTDLLGVFPSPMERLLVERIVASWLRVAYLTACDGASGPVPAAQREMFDRRLDRAERQHAAAIRSLAVLRRLEAGTSPRAGFAPQSAQETVEPTGGSRTGRRPVSQAKPRGANSRELAATNKADEGGSTPAASSPAGVNRLRAFVAPDEALR